MNGDGKGSPGIRVALLALAGLLLWWAAAPKGIPPSVRTVTTATPRTRPAAATPGVGRPFAMSDSLVNADQRESGADIQPLREAAAEKLRKLVPGVRIDFDEITGGPKHVMAAGRYLDAGPGRNDETVLRFIDAHRDLFGHGSDALAGGNSRITREDTTAQSGLRTLVWQQELDGIPFFQTLIRANLTKNGELLALGGNFLGDPAAATGLDPKKRADLIANPPLKATRAVVLAAADIKTELEEKTVLVTDGPQGIEKKQSISAPALSDTRAGLTWVPMGPDSARLAWDVTLMSTGRGEMFRVLVDAENGAILVRHGLTNYISNASYRVFAKAAGGQPQDSPTPLTPGHATPQATQPPAVARELVTLDALNTNASPNGWINDGVTETLGNNVHAHTDSDASPNVPDLPRPTSATRNFDFPLDPAGAPSTYRNAAVTQLFYTTNWIHDKLYDLGFTESAGNFQTDNFTRGGLGGDPVMADAQDGSGTNNANFSTPADGSPPRMQMYVFTGPTPDIDGDLDAEIVIHEYVHGLSNRLVGGGVGISASQSQGMGEGWSDFYALALLSEAGDDLHGNYAAGAYATRQFSGLTQNYYFGIRRYPYSTNVSKNPLTFKDLDPTQADAHAGIPRSPVIGNTANEIHNQGEVWCVALWEMRANLIARHGYSIGNPLALQLVTDGMKLTPANPNFLQARDAIVQADFAGNAGANRNELWAAFAKRGMGAGATSPPAFTTTGVVEAYDIPDALGVTPYGPFDAGGQVGGAISPASREFILTNNGEDDLTWTVGKTQPWLTLSSAGGILSPGATVMVTATFNVTTNSLPFGTYADTITFTNTTSGSTLNRAVNLTIEPLFNALFTDDFESGTLGGAWTITGTGTHRTQITTGNSPYAGARHLTMDSSVDDSYSRNEATLTLDLAGRQNVVLQFRVKMFNDEPHAPAIDSFTGGSNFDGVAVSGDGGSVWHEIRELRSISNDWQRISVDLDTAIASLGLAYTSNFKIRFNHYDNYTISTDGFAFDDILVAEAISNLLAISAPDSASEGDAPVTAVLSVTPHAAADLTVQLASDSPEATVPASVIVPAGSGSVEFAITPADDNLLDGSNPVLITASAPLYPGTSKVFAVHDDESATLTVDLPESITEGAPPASGLIVVDAPVDAAVDVTVSSDNSSLQLPPVVTIPAGATSAPFDIIPVNDYQINGDRPATITASVIGWVGGVDSMTILDDETRVLTLTLPRMREGDGVKSGSASISGTLATDLTVTLVSDDPTELSAPASVIIPAGQTSVAIPLDIVDDAEADGSRTITLNGAAAGFPDAAAAGEVEDNEVDHFTISPIDGPVLRNAPVGVTIVAKDITGATISNFSQPVSFTAADVSSAGVPLTPGSAGGFADGVLAVDLAFSSYATGAVLTATGAGGQFGTSNSFDIVTGPLDHFTWDFIPTPQAVDAPFPATLRALDAAGNPAIAFTGQVALSAVIPDTVEILTWTAYADVSTDGEYAHTKQAMATHHPDFRETTTTTSSAATLASLLVGKDVFLIVEQENATTEILGAQGTAWTTVLQNFVSSGGTVIACSNTTAEHLLLANSGLLDATSISSLSSATVTKPQNTPLNAGVATPFTGSYLHTYSTTNGVVDLQTANNQAVVVSRTLGPGRVVLIGTDFYTVGTGMDRIIANAVLLAGHAEPVVLPVAPANTTDFTAGVWQGEITVPYAAAGLKLRATSTTGVVESNEFTVEVPLPATGPGGGLAFGLPAEVNEGDGPVGATLHLTPAPAQDVVVNLVSKSPGKISVPETVTIAAGETSVNFDLNIEDDPFVDGTKNVVIAALTSGRPEIQTTVRVMDNDGGTLDLALPAATLENDGIVNGTISLSVPALSPLEISLVSDRPDVAAPQQTLMVTQGATTASFTVAIPDDGVVDGNQAAQLGATATGWTPAGAGLLVQDNESRALTLTIPPALRESDSPKSGTVSLGGTAAADLVISLASDDVSEITVPATITIPAGQSSATFVLTVQDDLLADGPQPFTVTATADTFITADAAGTVRDNEAHHFTFASFGSPMLRNGPVPAIITARDAQGEVIKDYNSPVTLTASGDSGPLVILPAGGGGFFHGILSESVLIDVLDTHVVLSVDDGLGHVGSSNPFDLVEGLIDRFEWDAVASPLAPDTPFTTTLRAVDATGATVPEYQGIAGLFVLASSQNPATGTGGTTTRNGIVSFAHDSRCNSLFTAAELGGAARITALSFNVTSLSATGQTLNNWTIRIKPTALPTLAGYSAWDNSGWTTVYQASPVISATGWVTFTFSSPFDFDGTANLLLDVSMDRTASNATTTFVQASALTQPFAIYGTSNSTHGNPLTWSGSTPNLFPNYQRPDLRFSTVKALPVRPARSGAFVNGVWTGEVSIPVSGNGLALRAKAGAVMGTSNSFEVSSPSAPPNGGATILSENFESGSLNPTRWTSTGTGNFRTVVTSSHSPHGGTKHLAMDTTSGYARNEATLTVDLAGRSGAVLEFWAAGFNDEPHGPPPAPFTGGADFDGVAISADGTTWWEVQGLRTVSGTYTQFLVDLDAAIASRGISYGSAFKIRFNHYDDNPFTTDGIVIDDILVTANSNSGFTLLAPLQITEGSPPASGSVVLDEAAATDTVVTLVSGAPAKLSLPGSVTVPAGLTSASFSLTMPDDNIADGNRSVSITGTVGGRPPRGISVTVLDDEFLPFTLSVPPSVAEGTTGHVGTLTLGAAASGTVTLQLASSDTAELTVPATAVFQPGQSRTTFPLTVINDTRIDGTRTVTVTADAPGWNHATASIQVTDDENLNLTLSPPLPVYEGGTADGSLSISGTLPNDLTVTLTSSQPSQLAVPATLTIPAGLKTVTFAATAVDDEEFDGIQSVTLTASAAGFFSATATAQARDNEVHHFGFQTITSPRKSSVPFTIAASARDINDSTITPFTGVVTFTAAGDAGPMALTPAEGMAFNAGTWTGSVACAAADTNVSITASHNGITGTSNAFDVELSPAITLHPADIALSLNRGMATTRNLAISNTGGGTLNWNITTDPSITAQSAKASATDVSLADALTNFNSNHGLVRAAIPNRYPFTEGVTGSSISDGGNDMYDNGNILNTNLGTSLAYSDNAIVPSAKLGGGGRYFTRKFDGLWVFAADVAGLDYFEIIGNLGADGSGSTDSTVLTLQRNGITYRGFVKRVHDAGDPSVNHLVIIEDNGSATQQASSDTNNDFHRLNGLTGVTRIYHVLYAGTGGSYIDNPATLAIMTSFIDAVSIPDWLHPATPAGDVPAGASQDVTLEISAATLDAGIYTRTLFIGSNDPELPQTGVPVTLTVTDHGVLSVTPATVFGAGGTRGGPVPPVSRIYSLTNVGGESLDWTAVKSASWIDLSPSTGTLAPGASVFVTATINSTATSLASGSHDASLTFTNITHGLGDTIRPVNLTIAPAAEMSVTPVGETEAAGTSGGPFSPAGITYEITNAGDADLVWSASTTGTWIHLSESGGTIAPGQSQPVTATIHADTVAPGLYDETIQFTNTTNGRGDTTRAVILTIAPPAPPPVAEPPFTPGAFNTIFWSPVAGADSYEAQVAATEDFSTALVTEASLGITATFDGLTDGTLYHYRIRSILDSPGGPIAGPWSAALDSTQDASPPALIRGTAFTSSGAIISPQGNATDSGAGVAQVTVNGKSAQRNSGTGDWTAPPLLLAPGDNVIVITAADLTEPPNIRTEEWTVTYTGPATTDADGDKLPDEWEFARGLNPADNGSGDPLQGADGDPDGDFIPNLLEYALGLDPSVRNTSGLPTTSLEINITDGKQYLTFQYRRRIQREGIHYVVETTASPVTAGWDGSGAGVEEISSQETGDGITETCTVRINPSTDTSLRKFIRLKVAVD